LLGRCAADPTIYPTKDGTGQVVKATIITSEKWKDAAGVQQERSESHRVVFFRGLAEVAAKYLKKGKQVFVEGSTRSHKYTDHDGVDRWASEIEAENLLLLADAHHSVSVDGGAETAVSD